MFQGIADQLAQAQKEIHRQEILSRYHEMLDKARKSDVRKRKRTETAFSKITIPEVVNVALEDFQGLKSIFFTVFGKQEQESDKKRAAFLQYYLLLKHLDTISDYFLSQQERVAPAIKSKKEVGSLQRLVNKIKSATLDKYYYPEVKTMFQLIDRSAQISTTCEELERAIETGEDAQRRLRQIVKNLKDEDSWGSWELFFSQKVASDNVPVSGLDFALAEAPMADAKIRTFSMLASSFFDTRDMSLHAANLEDFFGSFVDNMLYDWMIESKVRTLLSKTNLVLSSINMLLHRLSGSQKQSVNERAMMEVEQKNRIVSTEAFVKQKLSE
jgi:hypothetical protein